MGWEKVSSHSEQDMFRRELTLAQLHCVQAALESTECLSLLLLLSQGAVVLS